MIVNSRALTVENIGLLADGIKWATLVNLSIITQSSSQPLNAGRLVVKSIEMNC